jgi:hypothetical protein
MKGKVNCTCGWSWNKSDSSKKDMYICHQCGRDNSNNMKNGGWLDNYGTQANYNDSKATASPDMIGEGFSNVGRNYSPAWGGQFQGGGYVKKKLKKTERELLKKYVDPSTKKALERANQQGINTGIHNGPLDAIRHSSSAAAMTSALPTWTNFIPGVAPLKIAATNVAGAAHEIGSPNSWKEHASDLYNNFIGSVVGALPIPEETQHDLLIKAQKYGVLSDMGNKTPLRKKPAAPQLPPLPKRQTGGKLKFLQPTSDRLPEGYRIPYDTPSTERATSIGGVDGEPAYLVPEFKYGEPLYDPIEEFKRTGEHLGGPFKTWQEADEWEKTVRHPAVENRETIMFPQEKFQTGGSIPGAVGFTYARTKGIPSEGPYAKKTMPSAQNGQEMKYYQNGLDFKPKSISRDGAWLNKYEQAQTGKTFKLKDERLQAIRPSESTYVKKPNFEAEQAKVQRTYVDQLGKQMAEEKRRKKLTKEQREREDYNTINEQRGSIQSPVEESTWDRTKAIVSNPLTAFGYVARNESLPTRFQHGERNTLDYAVDWINPLQGAAALSEIPGELGRGEFLNAGLSALDAADLGVYARGAMKASKPLLQKAGQQLGNVKMSIAPELRQGLKTAGPSFASSANNVTNISKNLEDLNYAKKWAKQYGYELPKNLERIAQSDELTNRTVRGMMNRHNTFVRGISTNWEEIGKRNPQVLQHLEDIGIDYINNPKAAAEYMATHIPGDTGYGRFGLKPGENAIYLSNSKPTAEGYTYGQGYTVKVKKPTDFSSENRQDWLINNDFDAHLGFKGSPFGEGIVKNDYIKRFPVGLRETLAATGDPNKMVELQKAVKEKEALYNELAHASWKKHNNLISDLKYKTDANYRKYQISDDPFVRDTPNVFDQMHLNLLNTKKNLTQSYYNALPLVDIAKGVYGDPDVWKAIGKNMFGKIDPFSHYAIKGQPGEKVLEAINFKEIKPELWNNTSRGHINLSSKGLTRRKDGGIIKDDRGQWEHPGEITEISSNQITMEGVPYDVLGISDTGDTKLMKPGKNYKFKGKKVTEYPMAKNGINNLDARPLVKLDQLTNFTNYNKPQPGSGWLSKYN